MAMAAWAVPVTGQTKWTGPRTLDGHPDLEGTWLNPDTTPFEQAPDGKVAPQNTPPRRPAPEACSVDKTPLVARRPSMVVDPPNGRVPVMAWAEKVRDDKAAHIGDTWENGTTWDRCLTRGMPGAFFPANYNNAYQVIQTPGSVTILYETIQSHASFPPMGACIFRLTFPCGWRFACSLKGIR